MTPQPKFSFEDESLSPMGAIRLKMCPAICLTDDQFFDLCQQNDFLRLEQDANGDISIMTPEGGGSGGRSADFTTDINNWARRDGTGRVFGSSAGFKLPNGATRSPDLSWVRRERLAALPDSVKEKFLPLCPDFVVEIRSKSDSITGLQDKMEEYRENGAKLGWLIDPFTRTVWVYRPGVERQTLNNPATITGDPELPELTIDIQAIFDLRF